MKKRKKNNGNIKWDKKENKGIERMKKMIEGKCDRDGLFLEWKSLDFMERNLKMPKFCGSGVWNTSVQPKRMGELVFFKKIITIPHNNPI